MEIDFQSEGTPSVDQQIVGDDFRAKTSLRMHYEAQVEVIRRQTGDLEAIRETLGLSQRKIAQLLMVDPSAWSRWTKKKDPAPPHIYRALQWYLIIQEKIPGLTSQYFLGKDEGARWQVRQERALAELAAVNKVSLEKIENENAKWQMQMVQENQLLRAKILELEERLSKKRKPSGAGAPVKTKTKWSQTILSLWKK